MQRAFLYLLVLATITTSCYDTGLDSVDIDSEYDIVYLNNVSDPSAFSNDPYQIIAVAPKGDQWDVIVEYSGGCGEHIFYLWWSGEVSENTPSGTDFYLIHNGNGDVCKANIRDTVSFSLSEAVGGAVLDPQTEVFMHNETENRVIRVDPDLANLTSDMCNIPASIEYRNCNFGALGGFFLEVDRDVANHEKVRLQPVRVNVDSTVLYLQSRNVTVGVTVLFGYNYYNGSSGLDFPCDESSDEGTTVPVSIQCISIR